MPYVDDEMHYAVKSKKLDMNMSIMLSIVSMFDEFEMVSVITVDEECRTNDKVVTNDLSDFEVQFDRSEDVNIPHRIRTLFRDKSRVDHVNNFECTVRRLSTHTSEHHLGEDNSDNKTSKGGLKGETAMMITMLADDGDEMHDDMKDPWGHVRTPEFCPICHEQLFICEYVDVDFSNFQCEKSLTRGDRIDQCHEDMMLTHQMRKMTHDETATQRCNVTMTETVRHEHDEHRDKTIRVKYRGEFLSMTRRDLKHFAIKNSNVYAVHGGRVMDSKAIEQLKDEAIVHVVDKMPGGGKKKSTKKSSPIDQSTPASSSDADAIFELMDANSKMGRKGWNEGLIGKMLELDDDETADMLRKLRSSIHASTGRDPEPALEGLKRFLCERKQAMKIQQEEAAREQRRQRCETTEEKGQREQDEAKKEAERQAALEEEEQRRKQEEVERRREEEVRKQEQIAERQKQEEIQRIQEMKKRVEMRKQEETARERERQEEMRKQEEKIRERERSRQEEIEREIERHVARSRMTVDFGRYKGKTCESVYRDDRSYCQWISTQDSPNLAIIRFQEFIRTTEQEWENESRAMKRKELEEREKRLEANRREQLLQETRNMLAEMDMGFGPAVAARNGEETMTEQGDTMAAARRDNDEATVAAVRRNDDEAAMTATEQNNDEAAMTVEKHDDDDEMGNREDDMMTKTGRKTTSEIERVRVPGSQEGTIPAGTTSVETLTADKTGETTGTIVAETYDSQVRTTGITRDGMRSEVTRHRESTYYKRQPGVKQKIAEHERSGTQPRKGGSLTPKRVKLKSVGTRCAPQKMKETNASHTRGRHQGSTQRKQVRRQREVRTR